MNDEHGPDDVTGDRLREELAREAATVEPEGGSLGLILDRAHARSRWSWGAPALAAAAAVILVAGVVTAVAVSRPTGHGAVGGQGTSSSSTAPSTSGSASGSTSSSPSASSTAGGSPHALPVYYAGISDGQARLYREFHQVRTSQPAADAVRTLLGTAPLDPDYQSLWPARTTLVSYTTSGAVADVVLSSPPDRYPTAAFQQIVYTVTAADPAVTSVRIGYGSTTRDPLARGDATTFLSPVWLLSPTQGATVGSPVALSGTASVFEATVNWEVDRVDGTKVAGGYAMTPIAAPERGPWSTTVTLPAGHYVAKAFEISPQDGRWLWTDTKEFTVR